ncbi:SDR family NAD(P)-dependent oxidoreductase [Yoonia sp.]|uniref:SDR family NAD(P)-dependent oxidoreductase n=1 Tax=Yoonia sp. TaxID=2212373 RepID=UPI003F6D8BF7
MKRLENKVCIVTGGSRGIGKATCKRLAEEGAKVAITDVEDDEGESLRDQITKSGGTAEYWHLDVTDESAVKKVFDDVAGKMGGVDVVVNNAGIAGADKPTDEVTSEEWQKVMDVNVNGVFYCTKAAIPHMRSNGGGSIVNLSSIYGIVGAPDVPPYHASKGAVREMSKTDAVLYAKEGIRVNSVHPGFIWTPLVQAMAEASEDGPDAFRAHLDDLHPVGHVGEPEDIAAGIAYLASDDAKFVTGSELVIDGGYTAR